MPGSVASIESDWSKLLDVRQSVMVELEQMRANKEIGKGLDASVKILVAEGSPLATVLMKYELSLPEFFNVSQTTVQAVAETKNADAAVAEVQVAEGAKCARCWRVVPDVGVDTRWSEVCGRCAEALEAIGFPAVAGEVL